MREVLVDAAVAAGAATADGFLPAFLVRAHRGARGRPVGEMPGNCGKNQRLAANAGIGEARAELLVFRAPAGEVFVEAIRVQQIVAPERLVA